MLKTLDDEDVKEETIRVLAYIASQKSSEEIMAKFLNTVFLRKDVMDHLTKLLIESCAYTLNDPKLQKQTETFMLKLIQNKTIREGIFDNYVYSPIKNVVTFGYEQQRDQEQKQDEEESLKNFKSHRDNYNEASKDPSYQENLNKYPGYERN